MTLVLGIDGGGTSVRVALADPDGRVLASAKGPGINPNSGGDPESALTTTIAAALAELESGSAADITCGVAGLAGALSRGTTLQAALDTACNVNGVTAPVDLVSDLVVAFWSGLPKARQQANVSGSVLIAGTGAVAAEIVGSCVTALSDGYGPLLGDRGAGVWLGKQAVRAALDGESGRGPKTVLSELVLRGSDRADFLAELYAKPSKEVGQYAPAVDAAYDQGDPVATAIVEQAITELTLTLATLPSQSEGPRGVLEAITVLVGSVAAGDNPVGTGLRRRLRESGRQVFIGGSGLTGAVRLALLQSRSPSQE